MSYPTTYSWPIIPASASSPPVLPNPGPGVPGTPSSRDPRKIQFERGIKFANVPGGKASNSSIGGRVYHVNTVQDVILPPIPDLVNRTNGLVAFRNSPRYKETPRALLSSDRRSSDRFGNPVFPFTGRYSNGEDLPTIDNGFWNVQSFMSQSRNRYAGDLNPLFVQSGTVWIAGGLGSVQTPLSSALVFHTGTNSWLALPDMPRAKSDLAGVTLFNGDILVVGGSGSGPGETTSSFRYAVDTNSWSILPGTICSRKDHKVIKILDGRVFAPGGTGLSGSGVPFTGSEIFEPDSNTWYAHSGNIPGIPIYPYDREGYTLDLLDDGTVLLVGGRDPRTQESFPHIFRFYPPNKGNNPLNPYYPRLTGSWTVEQSMSFSRADHSTAVLSDGRVMIMGGNGGVGPNLKTLLPAYLGGQYGSLVAIPDVEIYDPRDGSVKKAGQMQRSRANFCSARLTHAGAEGRVVVAGGTDVDTVLSGVEICDVETLSWKRVTSLQVPVSHNMMFQLSSGSTTPYTYIVPSGMMTGTTDSFSGSQVYQTNG